MQVAVPFMLQKLFYDGMQPEEKGSLVSGDKAAHTCKSLSYFSVLT